MTKVEIKDQNNSEMMKLNKKDGIKIAKGAGIALGGAFLTYATEIIPMIDWGDYKPIVVAISSVIINAIWKLMKK